MENNSVKYIEKLLKKLKENVDLSKKTELLSKLDEKITYLKLNKYQLKKSERDKLEKLIIQYQNHKNQNKIYYSDDSENGNEKIEKQKIYMEYEDMEYEEKLNFKNANKILREEKIDLIKDLNETKNLLLIQNKIENINLEKLKKVDEDLLKTTKNLREGNKDLKKAYKLKTKTKTMKLKAGSTAIGGTTGFFVNPIIGTGIGALIGFVVGKKIGDKIEKKIDRNIDKMNKEDEDLN